MAKLLQQIAHVSTHLAETFRNEQALVKSLADDLNNLDQQLLRDIRQVAADHQIRRGTIFNALVDLAGSIGMFPPQHEHRLPEPVTTPQPGAVVPEQIDYGHQYGLPAGDWREATKNESLQDELEVHLNGLNGKGSRH